MWSRPAAEHLDLGHALDRAHQLGRLGGEAGVGRAARLAQRGQRPGRQRPDRVDELAGVVAAGHEHGRCRMLLHDPAVGLRCVHAGLDVHGDDVGPQPPGQPERLVPARRLPHDLQPRVAAEDLDQQPPGHRGVIDDQDPQRLRHRMVSKVRRWPGPGRLLPVTTAAFPCRYRPEHGPG
jgi:hypothetical protein